MNLIIKRSLRYEKAPSDLFLIDQNWIMTDPILYLSMILGLGGVYVLIASFGDDDDDSDDDGEKYLFNLEYIKARRWNSSSSLRDWILTNIEFNKGKFKKLNMINTRWCNLI